MTITSNRDFQHFIAGGLAGGAGAIITCPLEVAKTRLQAVNNKEFLTAANRGTFRIGTGMVRTMSDISKVEGILGLWNGIGPALAGVLPARAIWFTTYQVSKREIEKHFTNTADVKINFSAALIAGFSVATITSPIWLIKTRMQLQSKKQLQDLKYKNSIDCVRRVFKEEGIRGFYKGLTASYIGISESSLQMVLYEYSRKKVQKKRYKTLDEKPDSYKEVKLSVVEQLSVGSFAKLIAAAATYPHEVVRTRLREQRTGKIKYTGFFQALKVIAVEEGTRGLYGGLTAHLMRVVPNAAILFFVYERVMNHFRNQ